MLSWDLHVHPGLASEGRWGGGAELQQAAARAGVQGFVWKSHAGSSAGPAAAFAGTSPVVLPSVVLNASIGPADVEAALDQGVRWFWGPSRHADGSLGWDLPLPAEWPAIAGLLAGSDERVVVATSHLDEIGRRAVADLCEDDVDLLCSVTHSLYLSDQEASELARTGAVFEADLFTMTRSVRDWPLAELAARAELVGELGAIMYLTSDAGQAATGDPYVFVAEQIAGLGLIQPDQMELLTRSGPDRVAGHIVATTRRRS